MTRRRTQLPAAALLLAALVVVGAAGPAEAAPFRAVHAAMLHDPRPAAPVDPGTGGPLRDGLVAGGALLLAGLGVRRVRGQHRRPV